MWPLTRSRPPFRFLDPGPLIDGDLQLIPPAAELIQDVLTACRHPLTISDAPEMAKVTPEGLSHFLQLAPDGHHPGQARRDKIPSYHFWMRLNGENPPIRIAGGIGLRIGDTANLRNYIGHVGYNVYPPARGRHLAERATRLLFPLARQHGLQTLWITCNPDNIASKRTCERLGARYVNTVDVPPDNELHARGEVRKCRYRIDL